MNYDEMALNVLVKGIVSTIKQSVNKAKFNKGITGRIIEVKGNNQYLVCIGEQNYIAKSKLSFQVNDIVKIIKWNNSFDELYIIF